MTTARVGFIGLGHMGAPMASRLVGAGAELVVHDAHDDAVRQFMDRHHGVRHSGEWADVEVMILMLPNSAIVESVLTDELLMQLGQGSLVLDMSSSEPLRTRSLSQRLALHGIRLADAPVSGGVRGAVDGTLSILFGGADADLAEVRPLLETLGRTIIHVGPVGAGHAAKALNNLVSATTVSITSEALHIGEAFGIPATVMTTVLNSSSGRTNTSENKVEQFMLNGSFASGFSLALMAKDVGIASALADQLGIHMELGGATAEQWSRIATGAGATADHTAMYKFVGATEGDDQNE